MHQGLTNHPCVRIFGYVTKNERSRNRDAETIEAERCSLKEDVDKFLRETLFRYPRCFNNSERKFTTCCCLIYLSEKKDAVANTAFATSLMDWRDRQLIVKEEMRSASVIKT